MAYSGAVSTTTFNALKVVDHALGRCGLSAQEITAEMQKQALESLDLWLAEIASDKTPSWCMERLILPMYENRPEVTLPAGTEGVLNLNYRTIQVLDGEISQSVPGDYTVRFGGPTVVDTVGIKWSGQAPVLTFLVSSDGVANWKQVGSYVGEPNVGDITWMDITGALAYQYFKIFYRGDLNAESITLGNMPNEIPLGLLNRDSYVNQSNKVFPGRPNCYYFQRNLPQPVVHLWPAPNAAAEQAQLILWRHRRIMDTVNLKLEVEVPTRWLNAIINNLAAEMASQIPKFDEARLVRMEQKAAKSLQRAWDGDNDGSGIQINPGIGVYTR